MSDISELGHVYYFNREKGGKTQNSLSEVSILYSSDWNPLCSYETHFQGNNVTLNDIFAMNKTRKKIDGYLEELRNNQDLLVKVEEKLQSDSQKLEMLVTHNSELQKNMKVVQSKITLLKNQRSLLTNNCRELHSMIKRYTRFIQFTGKICVSVCLSVFSSSNCNSSLYKGFKIQMQI